jgi:hypothetical protein
MEFFFLECVSSQSGKAIFLLFLFLFFNFRSFSSLFFSQLDHIVNWIHYKMDMPALNDHNRTVFNQQYIFQKNLNDCWYGSTHILCDKILNRTVSTTTSTLPSSLSSTTEPLINNMFSSSNSTSSSSSNMKKKKRILSYYILQDICNIQTYLLFNDMNY